MCSLYLIVFSSHLGLRVRIVHRLRAIERCSVIMAEPRAAKLARVEALRTSVPYVSHSALAAILAAAQEAPLPKADRNTVREGRDRVAMTETPYGPLHQSMRIGGLDVEYQHPAAALYAFCSKSRAFSDLVRHTASTQPPTPARPWHLLIYLDEISPGNQLAYTHARKTWGIYYSVLEFGAAAHAHEDRHRRPTALTHHATRTADTHTNVRCALHAQTLARANTCVHFAAVSGCRLLQP